MFWRFQILTLMVILLGHGLFGQSITWQGQASSWVTLHPDPKLEGQIGLRYIPTISLQKGISTDYLLDAEIAFNGYGASYIRSIDDVDNGKKIKPYRLWIRFSSSQFEIRAGLQKINFGTATLLRPLMWFDRIDPRDPLQLTDGVYGILGRYFFLNNTNMWIWALYGNDKTRGWEKFPSLKKTPEFGGRMQLPVLTGELGITYHHRKADLKNQNILLVIENGIPEDRFAIDGKWDVGIGIWFESVLIHQDLSTDQLKYKRFINLGIDYTFNLGNGLNAMTEYFRLDLSSKPFHTGQPISFSALSANYPIGLLDNLNTIIYYDWDNKDLYRFLNVQRRYDNWSFYLMGFWNPEKFQIYQNRDQNNLFTGKGLQIMVVFNH